MRRVFYFAPIATDEINARYGTPFVPGASTNKVLGVCAALREAGVAAVAVSGLVPARGRDLMRCAALHRQHGVPYVRAWSLGRAGVKRLTASLGYLAFALRTVRRQDRVLLYNFFPDYIPAALALRLIGRPAILDIEDAPPADEPGARGHMNRISLRILRRLCAPRVVTVSHHLGRQLGLADYLPVHGIARPAGDVASPTARFEPERVAILFGGSIAPETGLDLFAAALRILARRDPDLPARFVVTGHYPADALEALKHEIEQASRITLELHAGLSTAAYRALLDEVAIGLSLKLPESSLGQTTFPSKVIEYAAAGLLLVATPVSDIPTIFADGAAVILPDTRPETLADRLASAIRDRAQAVTIAARGQAAIGRAMSPAAVGPRLAGFLFA